MRLGAIVAAACIALAAPSGSGAAGAGASTGPACVGAPAHVGGPPPTPGNAPRGVPWTRSGRVVAYLFAHANLGLGDRSGVAIFSAGGSVARGLNQKILWYAPGRSDGLTISGRRLDGRGLFFQRFPAIDGGYFPSIVDVPAPGCWRLTVGTGRLHARFAFRVVAG